MLDQINLLLEVLLLVQEFLDLALLVLNLSLEAILFLDFVLIGLFVRLDESNLGIELSLQALDLFFLLGLNLFDFFLISLFSCLFSKFETVDCLILLRDLFLGLSQFI
jgi:hypothetical protein